jgi:tetratricopeptide (TPR) repeat protein
MSGTGGTGSLDGDFSEAAAGFIAQAERASASGDPATAARCYLAAVRLHMMASQTVAASAVLVELEELGYAPAERELALALAELADLTPDVAEQTRAWRRVLASADKPTRLTALERLTRLAAAQGDWSSALSAVDAALALAASSADDRVEAVFTVERARVLRAQGALVDAREALDRAAERAAQRAPQVFGLVAAERARLALALGNWDTAAHHAADAQAAALHRWDVPAFIDLTTLRADALERSLGVTEAIEVVLDAQARLSHRLGAGSGDPLADHLAALRARAARG